MAQRTLSLTDPLKFSKDMLKFLAIHINDTIKKAKRDIEQDAGFVIDKHLRQSPEIIDLQKGDLRGHMGLRPGQAAAAVNSIISSVTRTVAVNQKSIQLRSGKSASVLDIEVQPSSFQNIVNIPQSTISYYSIRYKKTVNLKWLEWLLFQGDRIVVSDFYFEAGSKGRSGAGKMKERKGSYWRVPPYYSGTVNDNFITRAFSGTAFQKDMENAIVSNIERYW